MLLQAQKIKLTIVLLGLPAKIIYGGGLILIIFIIGPKKHQDKQA
jgi:hypothetical protein